MPGQSLQGTAPMYFPSGATKNICPRGRHSEGSEVVGAAEDAVPEAGLLCAVQPASKNKILTMRRGMVVVLFIECLKILLFEILLFGSLLMKSWYFKL